MGTDLAKLSEAAFRSERLVFKSFENTESAKASFFAITNDSFTQAVGDPSPFQPKTRQSSDELFTRIQTSSVIAVFICLPIESETGGEAEKDGPLPKSWTEVQVIGFMTATKPSYDAPFRQRQTSLSIAITKEYRRRGYGMEAQNWLLDWIFNYSGMHRVGASSIEYNVGSIASYRKLGFIQEGRTRDSVYFKRKWYDLLEFSMLEKEWEVLRGFK